MANKWKIVAIIFIVLFCLLLAFNIWAVKSVLDEEAKTSDCYYNICEGSYDAWLEEGVCACYNENYEVIKTEYMK